MRPYCVFWISFNPLKAELNPIRHLPELVVARHIDHVSRIRVNICFHLYMSLYNMILIILTTYIFRTIYNKNCTSSNIS